MSDRFRLESVIGLGWIMHFEDKAVNQRYFDLMKRHLDLENQLQTLSDQIKPPDPNPTDGMGD